MEFEDKKERLIELKDKKTDLELRKSAMQGFIENFEKAPRVIQNGMRRYGMYFKKSNKLMKMER